MKIVRLSTFLDFGGLETRLANLSHIQDENEWVFCFFDRDGNAASLIRSNGKRTINLDVPTKLFNLKTYRSLYQTLKEEQPDVLHCSGLEANFYGIPIGRILGIKIIAEEIGIPKRNWKVDFIFAILYKFANYIIGNSIPVIKYLHKYRGVAYKNLRVIHNPFPKIDIPEETKYELSNKNFNLISVSRLKPVKNIEGVIRVVERLIKDGYPINYYIIGEGSSRPDLEKLIKTKNLGAFIHLMGYESKPIKYVSKADVFILNSFTEGFSNSLTEAMYAKVPSITTDCGAAREMINDGKTGYIIPHSDDALYNTIAKLYNKTPAERKLMGERAHSKIINDFTLEHHVKELMKIYK